MNERATDGVTKPDGSPGEVFLAFLQLGLTSFGGPIAHLGYFREEFVVRRRWIDEAGYADLVAICQFLPGPASSQVGFALGLRRGGPLGALLAWAGFTLPSAILLVAFAYGASLMTGPVGGGIVSGLKIVAVAIVAQAVWGMARTLTPDRSRASIALAAVVAGLLLPGGAWSQAGAIALGGLAGLIVCRGGDPAPGGHGHFSVSRGAGLACFALFGALLAGLPLLHAATPSPAVAVIDGFYRAGALVFGGGHVVLPLLESETVARGWATHGQFLAGYGAAQAVPGPLFTFAAYLGAILGPEPNGLAGAALALVAVFLPGLLLVTGALPFWDAIRARPGARGFMAGASAAVVGILGAALYDPVVTSAIDGPAAFALALACFVLLVAWKAPPWTIVLVAAAGGVLMALV